MDVQEPNTSSEKSSEPAAPGRLTKVSRNPAGQLVAEFEKRDEPAVDVRVARCFPWSVPDCYISIRSKEGKELAMLNSLDDVDEESRAVLAGELSDKVFNPKIRRILNHASEFGVMSFTAETDRGEVTFQISSRDDIRMLSPTRALFRDADGNNYEIPDITALDPASHRHLAEYL